MSKYMYTGEEANHTIISVCANLQSPFMLGSVVGVNCGDCTSACAPTANMAMALRCIRIVEGCFLFVCSFSCYYGNRVTRFSFLRFPFNFNELNEQRSCVGLGARLFFLGVRLHCGCFVVRHWTTTACGLVYYVYSSDQAMVTNM